MSLSHQFIIVFIINIFVYVCTEPDGKKNNFAAHFRKTSEKWKSHNSSFKGTVNRIRPKIVGGVPYEDGVTFTLQIIQNDIDFKCPAALCQLSWMQFAITAAQCAKSLEIGNLVVAGTAQLGGEGENMQSRTITRIKIHDSYEDGNIDNDIALLFFNKPFAFTDYVFPVKIAGPGWDGPSQTTILGWGSESTGGELSPIMKIAHLDRVNSQVCFYTYLEQGFHKDSHFCAGNMEEGGVGACTGDIGAPAAAQYQPIEEDEDVKIIFLVGIVVSIGLPDSDAGCAAPRQPTVMLKVSSFRKWIFETVDDYKEEVDWQPPLFD